MTLYRLLLSRVGLSQADAAILHQVRLDTIKSWCAGRARAGGRDRGTEDALRAPEEGRRRGPTDDGRTP